MHGYDRLPWSLRQSVARSAPRRSLLRVAENKLLNSRNISFVGYIAQWFTICNQQVCHPRSGGATETMSYLKPVVDSWRVNLLVVVEYTVALNTLVMLETSYSRTRRRAQRFREVAATETPYRYVASY